MVFATNIFLCNLSRHLTRSWGSMACRQMHPALTKIQLSGSTCSQAVSCFHSSPYMYMRSNFPSEPKEFLKYNDIVYPPQKEGEMPRPAEVVHQRASIKYSMKKMFYLCLMVRGLSVDEALRQLQFHPKEKGAKVLTEVIKEAQELAVKDHHVEYKSNLWIEHAFSEKAHIMKGFRKHSRGRYCTLRYRYLHLFIRLREGSPPEHYYKPISDGNEKMAEYIQNLRNRRIFRSL